VAHTILSHHLSPARAKALSALIDVLDCGEESASLVFGLFGTSDLFSPMQRHALASIAADETRHEGWLKTVSASLGSPRTESADYRRFFIQLARDDTAAHLIRVAALDSAVCRILAATLRSSVIRSEPAIADILTHIHRDEARHVAIVLAMLPALPSRVDQRELVSACRGDLVAVLERRADAFETIGVDPDMLFKDLSIQTLRFVS
jgi:hypothetical protein